MRSRIGKALVKGSPYDPTVDIALLGPVAVRNAGVAIIINAAKERAVLSLLALQPGDAASFLRRCTRL